MAKKRFFILLLKLGDSFFAAYLSKFQKEDYSEVINKRAAIIAHHIDTCIYHSQINGCDRMIDELYVFGIEAVRDQVIRLRTRLYLKDTALWKEERIADGDRIISNVLKTA